MECKARVRVFNFSLRFGIRREEERDGEGLRESFGGASTRVRVFNLNLQIKIERGNTVSGWQGGTGQEAAEWVLAERRGEEDRAKVRVWVKIRFEVKLIRILLVPLRPQKWG